MARQPNYTVSQREAAQRIADAEVENLPEVMASRRALADAEKVYAATMEPRKAAMARLEELRAERASAETMLAEADARRVEVALGVTDGELLGGAYHSLRDLLDEIRLEIERIDLSLPAVQARYDATSSQTERAANSLSDAQAALLAALKSAKLELAVAQGV